jgi:hypothetical protein
MAILKVFKSRAPVMGYAFKNGNVVYFREHMYATLSKAEIEELTTECENGHPNYYIDPEQTEIDSEQMDPIAVLTAKIREEERAKLMAAVGNPHKDMGQTEQGKLQGISNSHSIMGVAAASETQATAARTPIKVASPAPTK